MCFVQVSQSIGVESILGFVFLMIVVLIFLISMLGIKNIFFWVCEIDWQSFYGQHNVNNVFNRLRIFCFRNTMGDDYFSFWAGGCFCIVLNSQYFHDDSKVLKESKEHLQVIDIYTRWFLQSVL